MCGDNSDENPENHTKDKWYNHRPSKWSIAIAAVLLYGFFVLFEVHDIWPFHPLIAVLVGIPVTIAVLYLEAFVQEAISFPFFLISSAIVIVAGIAIFSFAPRGAPEPPIAGAQPRMFEGSPGIPFDDEEVRGMLKPSNQPTPPNGCDRWGVNPDTLKVLIGDNAIKHDGMGLFTAIGINDCSAIAMNRTPDGVFVSASLYDSEKQSVVSIKDNKITTLNGETYTARQGRDESSLTIRNARGDELFYIQYLNPTTIRFRGFLHCEGGPVVHVQDDQPVAGVFMSKSCLGHLQIGHP